MAFLPCLRIGVELLVVSSCGSEDAASGGHFLASFPIRYTAYLTPEAAVRDPYLDSYREWSASSHSFPFDQKSRCRLVFSRFETDRFLFHAEVRQSDERS